MYRFLIVDDEEGFAQAVKEQAELWGLEAECVRDFRNIMTAFAEYAPHLVLMDIGLPFYNGYYWCGEIRKISQVPIIFISSASDNMNVVMAINMGGDDFIVKPFDLEILSAKVQAILRRAYSIKGQSSLLEHNGVILSLGDMTLLYEEQKLELTKNEFRIIQILFENAGNVVSRENIMKRLWDNECFVDENTLTVNINRLRKRLEDVGLKSLILTRKGVGYQLEE